MQDGLTIREKARTRQELLESSEEVERLRFLNREMVCHGVWSLGDPKQVVSEHQAMSRSPYENLVLAVREECRPLDRCRVQALGGCLVKDNLSATMSDG